MMEETSVATDESYDYDSFDEQNYERPAERWAPLGATASPAPSMTETSHVSETEQLRALEEEQEELNSALLSLTTHFAQVQFRLKQIVAAPAEEKEGLLKSLEEFAFKGVPDMRSVKIHDDNVEADQLTEQEHEIKLQEQREKQQELISQLKSQLEDMEKYAYETGTAEEPPTSVQIEKQKVVIDELKTSMDLQLDDLGKLSPEQLREVVNNAVAQIVNPGKVKEKLVDQLRTQVSDLERFISFLQGESTSPGPLGGKKCTCSCNAHNKFQYSDSDLSQQDCCIPEHKHRHRIKEKGELGNAATAISIMKRALAVLQIFAIGQFGCGGREFERNLLKRTTTGNHWGDLRAKLEIAIEKVMELGKQQEHTVYQDSDYNSDSEESYVIQCNQALVVAVRKDLAIALRDLMQHGLMEVGQSNSLVPIGCFAPRSRSRVTKMMHAWDLIVKYYGMKHGKEYNESPARKLAQSFDLNIVGGKAVTAKQTLLGAVDTIRSSHLPLKRSEDSQFKAFVCYALNEKKLVTWLRLIFKTSSLVEFYYQPWSYVGKTHFEDAFQSLQKLTTVDFRLPVDLAVKPFNSIKDAF